MSMKLFSFEYYQTQIIKKLKHGIFFNNNKLNFKFKFITQIFCEIK